MMAKRSPLGSQEKSVTVSIEGGSQPKQILTIESPTLQLDDLNREVLFSNPEDFQVAENGLLRLCMTVYLDAKEVALVLPIEFTLHQDMRRCRREKKRSRTSETLNKFFWRRIARPGKLMTLTRAG